mgnify:CR=1 FL=1
MSPVTANLDTQSLLICGFLWSGSSAVVDLLRSSSEVGLLPGEFDEFRRPGMVADHLEGMISEYYPSMLPFRFSVSSFVKRVIPFDRKLRYMPVPKHKSVRESLLMNLAAKLREADSSDDEKRRHADEWFALLKNQFAPKKQ